jgi:hypothetical protein
MTKRPGAIKGPNDPLPPGETSLDLPFGPVRLRIKALPVPWHPFIPDHYAPFAEAVSPQHKPDLRITCREGQGDVLPLPPPGGLTRLTIDGEGKGRYRIRSHWQDGWVDMEKRTGEIIFTDRRYVHFRMSLENYLRVASQLALVDRGAFMLHSAGILDKGRCFLLFGPSGAGKSTATANSLPRPMLSDDMVLIDVSMQPPLAHAVPFFGLFPSALKARGGRPIAAAARLRKDPEDRLRRLSRARAAVSLSASVPFVHEFGFSRDRLTDLIERFVAAVPVYDLHLTNSGRFWSLLDDIPPA